MRLAMKWNKVEIAKQTVEYLDKNYSYFYCDDYYNLMETALTDNRLDFFGYYMNEFRYVKDFMANFVTSQRLYYLYNFKNQVDFVFSF